MGTNSETIELQKQIKSLIAELGWSQNQLARNLFIELFESDNEDEMKSFQERLKKDLQRTTTKVERLKKYLSIVLSHPDAKGLDVIFNKPVYLGAISPSLQGWLTQISKDLDKKGYSG